MAVRWAVQNGNWSDPNTWNGGTLPGSGDDVYANGKTVTIDQNVTCLSLRTEAESGSGVIGGGEFQCSIAATIDVSGGVGIRAGTSVALRFTGVVGVQLTVIGNVTGGSAGDTYGIHHAGAGNLVVAGNVTAGSGYKGWGIYTETGSVSITGNVTGGANISAYGVYTTYGTVTITGNVTGGSNGNAQGAYNTAGTVTITGNVTGGSSSGAHGVYNTSGTVTITGDVFNGTGVGVYNDTGTVTIYGSAKPNPANPLGNHALYHASTTAGYIAVDAIEPDPTTLICPSIRGRVYIRDTNTGYIRMYDTLGQLKTFITSDNVNNPPAESDVRYGVQYTAGNSRTGTARIPPPASVAYGVPVDHTTGTAVLTVSSVANAVWDEPRSNHTTAGTYGNVSEWSGSSPAAVAAAVWDEPRSNHTTDGTYGKVSEWSGSNPAAVADAVWDELRAGHNIQGSFGAAIDTNIASRLASDDARLANLDAAVSTRVATSDARLNNLDAAVSTRVAASDTRLDNLDATVSSRLANSDSRLNNLDAAVSTRVATTDPRLNNLDASVSSRLASTSYVVPPTVADIWSHTTRTLTEFGFSVTVGVNNDKTGYSLTADYDRAKTALASTEYVNPDNAGIAAIRQQTDKIQFSATNLVLADMAALSGNAAATSTLGKVYGALETGTVAASASNTPTKFRVSFTVDAEKHTGRFLMFSAGTANQGQTRKITGVDTASNAVTLNAALDTTPATGDEFVLIGYGAS